MLPLIFSGVFFVLMASAITRLWDSSDPCVTANLVRCVVLIIDGVGIDLHASIMCLIWSSVRFGANHPSTNRISTVGGKWSAKNSDRNLISLVVGIFPLGVSRISNPSAWMADEAMPLNLSLRNWVPFGQSTVVIILCGDMATDLTILVLVNRSGGITMAGHLYLLINSVAWAI